MAFLAVIPSNDVVGYQCFGVPHCLHLHGEVPQRWAARYSDRVGYRCFGGPWLPPSSWWGPPKMETAWSQEMLVSYHIPTWCHDPENHGLNLHHCENLKFHTSFLFLNFCHFCKFAWVRHLILSPCCMSSVSKIFTSHQHWKSLVHSLSSSFSMLISSLYFTYCRCGPYMHWP